MLDEQSIFQRGWAFLNSHSLLSGVVLLGIGTVVTLFVTQPHAAKLSASKSGNPPVRELPISDYVTEDPRFRPRKSSSDFSLLGIEVGTPVSDVNSLFAGAAKRTVSEEGKQATYEWRWRGIRLIVQAAGRVPAVQTMQVNLERRGLYVSLPRGLLLGEARVSDAARKYGGFGYSDLDGDVDGGFAFYDFRADYGAEGTFSANFTAAADLDAYVARDAVTPDACKRLIRSVEIGYLSQRGRFDTPPDLCLAWGRSRRD